MALKIERHVLLVLGNWNDVLAESVGDPLQRLGPGGCLGPFIFGQQRSRLDTERHRQPAKGADRRVALPPFELAQIAALHIGIQGEMFLGNATAKASGPNILPEQANKVHCATWTKCGTWVCPLGVTLIMFSFINSRLGATAEARAPKFGRYTAAPRVDIGPWIFPLPWSGAKLWPIRKMMKSHL